MIIVIMGGEPTAMSGLMILFCFSQHIQITNGAPKGFNGGALGLRS